MFYPQGIKCAVCGRDIFEDDNHGICGECSFKANTRFCRKCGRAIGETSVFCDDCMAIGRSFVEARAPFIFEGKAKQLIYKLKYGGAKYISRVVAQFLADEYYKLRWDVDLITFVPIHEKRLSARGYNQAQLIAAELSDIVNVPICDTLEKIKFSKNFARLKRNERIKEAEGSFKARDRFPSKSILLIDDVFTTGATTDACSKELLHAGAKKVYVLTFCTSVCRTELY